MNKETTRARELILLFRSDLNCEFNVGEIGTGKLEALRSNGTLVTTSWASLAQLAS